MISSADQDYPHANRFSLLQPLLFCVVAGVVLLVPFQFPLPSEVVKNAFFGLGSLVLFALVMVSQIRRRVLIFPRSAFVASSLLLSLSFLVSALLSSEPLYALGGLALGPDSGLFLLFFSVFLYTAFLLFRRFRNTAPHSLYRALGWIFSAALILQAASFFGFPAFNSSSDTVAGGWTLFPIFAGLSGLYFAWLLDEIPIAPLSRSFFLISFAASFILAVFVAYPPASFALLSFFVLLLVQGILSSLVRGKEGRGLGKSFSVPWHAIAGCVLSLILVVFGGSLSLELQERIQLPNVVEVRPSHEATFSIATKMYSDSAEKALFGVGPGLFSQAWNLYKGKEVNGTAFWDIDFETASSLIGTFMVTAGAFGLFALLLWYGSFFYEWLRSLRRMASGDENSGRAIPLFLLSAYCFFWPLVYVSNAVLFLLGALLFAFGSTRAGLTPFLSFSFLPDARGLFPRIAVLLFVTILSSTLIYAGGAKFFSLSYHERANAAFLLEKSISDAKNFAARATELAPLAVYHETRSLILQREVDSLLQDEITEEKARVIEGLVREGRDHALRAVELNPENYRNWITLGNSVLQMHLLLRDESPEFSRGAYEKAIALSPSNPIPEYLLGRFFVFMGAFPEARSSLRAALLLKSDYEPALSLLKDIESQ